MNSTNIDIGQSTYDFLVSKKKTLVDAIAKLSQELAGVDIALKALNTASNANISTGMAEISPLPAFTPENYRADIDWKATIKGLLNSEQRVLRTIDIISLIFQLASEDEKKLLRAKASNKLNYITNRSNPEIRVYVSKNPETYYFGLPEWFEEDGSLKDEYLNKIEKAA